MLSPFSFFGAFLIFGGLNTFSSARRRAVQQGGITSRQIAAKTETVVMYWHALYTRARHEKCVVKRLTNMGVDAFLPLAKVMSRWKDRRKLVHKPLFPSYLFFRTEQQKLFDIAQSKGVVRILGEDFSSPSVVDETIIDSLKKLVSSGLFLERYSNLDEGDRARIVRGPLRGLEGTLVATRRRLRLVIWVKFVNSGAAVEVGAEDVEPA